MRMQADDILTQELYGGSRGFERADLLFHDQRLAVAERCIRRLLVCYMHIRTGLANLGHEKDHPRFSLWKTLVFTMPSTWYILQLLPPFLCSVISK